MLSCRPAALNRWESEAAFEEFRQQFAAQYEALDRECEGLTQTETKIGIFERRD